jgi:hypothetical protein
VIGTNDGYVIVQRDNYPIPVRVLPDGLRRVRITDRMTEQENECQSRAKPPTGSMG